MKKIKSLLHGAFFLSQFLFFSFVSQWSAPVDVITGSLASSPEVGIDETGRAIILATASTNDNGNNTKALEFVGGVPQNLQEFESIGLNLPINQLSVNRQGNATALWLEMDPFPVSVPRSTSLVNGVWSSPITLNSNLFQQLTSEVIPRVKMDDSNGAVAVWDATDQANNRYVQFNIFSSGWQAANTITTSIYPIHSLVMDGDSSGNVLASWFSGIQDDAELKGAYFNGSVWNVTTLSSELTTDALTDLAINQFGKGMIVWQSGQGENINTMTFDNGTYDTQQVAARDIINLRDIKVAIDKNGAATIVMIQFQDNINAYWLLTTRNINGNWQGLTLLDIATNGDQISSFDLDSDGLGNIFLVWQIDEQLGNRKVMFNRYDVNEESWQNPSTLLSTASSEDPKISVNENGDAVVVWKMANQTSQSIQAVYNVPDQPTNLVGRIDKNQFLYKTETYKSLSWSPSSDLRVTLYNVYRDGVKIGSIPANGQLFFVDHDRNGEIPEDYGITAVTSSGFESSAVSITLPE